jgi:HAD superfamily hydrolase (TIGR01549 family)
MRGYYLSELADGGYSFCDALFILFQGRISTDKKKCKKYEMGAFAETEQVLKERHSKYLMAIITNTQRQKTTQKYRISLFPKIKKFFMDVFVAGESGMLAKPNPNPFLIHLKKMGISPLEAGFVGDDGEKDNRGTREAGIQPIWLQHHSVQRN